MNYDVGEATEVWRMNCDSGEASHTSQLILQLFGRFTCVKTHSTTLPMLRLRHFTYITWRTAHARS